MEMDFRFESVNGLAKALGGRIDLLEKLIVEKGLTPEMIQIINDSGLSSDFFEETENGGFVEKPHNCLTGQSSLLCNRHTQLSFMEVWPS